MHIEINNSNFTAFDVLFQNIKDAVFIWELNENGTLGECIDANNTAVELVGGNRSNIPKIELENLIKINGEAGLSEVLSELQKSGVSTFESNICEEYGAGKTVEITAKVVLLGGKKRVISFLRDITEERKLLNKVKKDIILFDTFLENVPASVYFKDSSSRFKKINKPTLEKFGCKSESDVIGKTDYDFFHKIHADSAYRDEKALLKGEIDCITKEEREVFNDKEIKWVSTIKIPFKNGNNKIVGTCGISTDITEKKLVEHQLKSYMKELEKMNMNKDKFFSIIAHDLKGPFNSLLGFTRLLRGEYEKLSEYEIKVALKSINKSAENIYQLLENLLQIARTQLKGIIVKPKYFNISENVNDIVHLLNEYAVEKNIKIINNIKDEYNVCSEKFMFETVIRNILHNAIKFTNRNGDVKLSAEKHNDYTDIIIKDSGIGMSTDDIENIFDMELENSRLGTMNEQGTGLGLSLCKEFIDKNNGSIKVESIEGEGSIFRIRLPN
ncbi:MAG: PAS domain-containing sensor histidine kinase [Melioribacteraceae bacterium]|nr:PAS domain-containing sensor histidine kinase [Melioribacteraceae bacterium]